MSKNFLKVLTLATLTSFASLPLSAEDFPSAAYQACLDGCMTKNSIGTLDTLCSTKTNPAITGNMQVMLCWEKQIGALSQCIMACPK